MTPTEEVIKLGVSGGTPGADSNDYKLFDSTTLQHPGTLSQMGVKRIIFGVNNSHSGTLKAYWSIDKGTTWNQYYEAAQVAASAPTMTGPIDFDIVPYDDWKLVWTNGGSAQTTWRPHLHGTTSRTPAT